MVTIIKIFRKRSSWLWLEISCSSCFCLSLLFIMFLIHFPSVILLV